MGTPDKWVELKESELKSDDAIGKSVEARFGSTYFEQLKKEFAKQNANSKADFYKKKFENKRKDAFKEYIDNLFIKDSEEALVNCVDLPLEGMTDVLSWQKVMRQRLVKAYYYVEKGTVYDEAYRTPQEYWEATHTTDKGKWADEKVSEKEITDTTNDNDGRKKQLRSQWVKESNDPKKRRQFCEKLLERFNTLGTKAPFTNDPEIIFNICSGVIAGKLQQELNPTYMCSLARTKLAAAEGLLETKKILDVLSASIQIKVGAKADPIPITIGFIHPSPASTAASREDN